MPIVTDFINNEIIAMAWDDRTSFDSIKELTGFSEKMTISLMKQSLKPSSFKLWRKRIKGRKSKHGYKKLSLERNEKTNFDL